MTYLTWQSTQWVRHTRVVQFAAARALHLSQDRRSSIGDYVITGDSATLVLEAMARPALQLVLDSLATLSADNEAQQAQLVLISAALHHWDSTYADRVLGARSADERARIGREQGAGASAFANVRAAFDAFLAEEGALYVARVERNAIWRWAEVAVVAIEAVLVLVLLSRMRAAVLTQAAATLEHQEELEEQAVELEAQAAEQEMLSADLQLSNQKLVAANGAQEVLTSDLEIANQELVETSVAMEASRDRSRALEERYRLLFEGNPVPMWVYDGATLRFVAVNEAAVQQYGYSTTEFLAMSIEELRADEDVEPLRAQSRGPDGAINRSTGWRHRRRDGSCLLVDIVTHCVEFEGRPAHIVLAMDITAREKAKLALTESNGILRAVVDDSPLAIVICSSTLLINKWNAAATKQFGYSAEEAIGQSLLMLIPEEKRAESAELRARLGRGEIITNFETQRRTQSGTLRDVSISQCTLHADSGDVSGFVTIYSDETERKRLEAQYRQSQKMEAIGLLAGGVAHDFNNLLTVIISYSQMLLSDGADGTTARADVTEIKRAAERAALLTKQLLAFSRQQVLRPHVLDLNAVIGGLEQMLSRLLRDDISVVMSLGKGLGSVAADPGQIEQIIMNLAVNARDAMPHGGRLSIETANVVFESPYQLRASEAPLEAGSYVMIAVSDNGAGMTSDVQAKIFEPFFTTKRLHEGTGLGLSTVYGIVKQSGGHLAMYSEPGEGTIFKIYLPRVDATPNNIVPDDGWTLPSSVNGETVLIVEDDDALRIVACRALEQCGYTVLVASDGIEALRQCALHEGDLQLVVTDMVMPEMSGADLAESVALIYPDVRVLLMSGYTRDETARRGIASERYAFLEKPFTPMRLAAKVREVLDAGRNRAPSPETVRSPA